MKLFYTPNSPYARIVRVIAIETGIAVDFVKVAVRESVDELLHYNPAAKVPALELDDGVVLTETRIISEHLESLGSVRFLAAIEDTIGRQREGLVNGFLDGVAVWIREVRRSRDERSPGIIDLENARALRCLEHFEQTWPHDDASMNFASIALASTLDLANQRLPVAMEDEYPGLWRWLETFLARPAMRQTSPLPP